MLKKLRTIYREQLAGLETQREANAAELIAPYTARLQELEATLTKGDRIADAKLVMDYRNGLRTNVPINVAATAGATSAATTPAPAMSTSTAARTTEGDDEEQRHRDGRHHGRGGPGDVHQAPPSQTLRDPDDVPARGEALRARPWPPSHGRHAHRARSRRFCIWRTARLIVNTARTAGTASATSAASQENP